ncbi:hypothetical protein Bca4012_085354 [Brassica carinata]|uniref:UEV domain-containing protein n=1 Tax=Brassica carinata TaxID=52824 RepID=A0A8X7SGV2_BRACI|nr:hypothetical protein Bca52824_025535 [Brassica carinata]
MPTCAALPPSGLVSLPYLHNWDYPSSNLVGLVSEVSSAFGPDPPLYSRRCPRPRDQSDDVAEVYKLVRLQGVVRRREEDEIKRRLREMVEEKERLEQQLQIISTNTDHDVLDSWVRENQVKIPKTLVDDVNVDKCLDAISKQNVRLLMSREQFVQRAATGSKVEGLHRYWKIRLMRSHAGGRL